MIYKKLDSRSYEIRILNLEKGTDDGRIHCTLEHTTLIEPGSYFALSYCWGDLTKTKQVIVDGNVVEVTENLAHVLRQVRSRKYRLKRVWVDAICINQDDKEERGLQVRNMQHIYSKAQYVISCLGDDPGNIARAIRWLFEKRFYQSSPEGTPLEYSEPCQEVHYASQRARSTSAKEERWRVQR
jgi:hypothetical protein